MSATRSGSLSTLARINRPPAPAPTAPLLSPEAISRAGGAALFAGVAPYACLPPPLIPGAAALRAEIGTVLLLELGMVAAGAAGLPHKQAAAALLALSARLAPSDSGAGMQPAVPPGPATPRPPANDEEHDSYFAIVRVAQPVGTVFLRSLLLATALFHQQIDEAPRGAAFATIGRGFHALLGHIADFAPAAETAFSDEPATEAGVAIDPVRRWALGHHVFTALTHGLIYALQEFETAFRQGDPGEAELCLALVSELLQASAACLRFTGDFPPEAYRDLIRPSMAPPYQGEGFSGLLSSDHRQLIKLLGRLRPLMARAEQSMAETHQRLTAAFESVYDNHKFVCARFDGASKPSLRGKGATHASSVDQLEKFKAARTRLIRRAPGEPGQPEAKPTGRRKAVRTARPA